MSQVQIDKCPKCEGVGSYHIPEAQHAVPCSRCKQTGKIPATPEPREPEAREAVMPNSELEATLLANPVYRELRQMYCYKGAEFSRPTLEKGWKEIERLEAYSAELRVRVKELETADIQRAKDITRLTIERDEARAWSNKWESL